MMSTRISHLPDYLKLLKRFPKRRTALFVGDSWFQYPLRKYRDLEGLVDHEFNNELLVMDDSIPGRDADEIIGLSDRYLRTMEFLRQQGRPFQVIGLSLGGNDVIGSDFARHLLDAHQRPGADTEWAYEPPPAIALTHFNFPALRETFSQVRKAYQSFIKARDLHASRAWIICHTYADVTPSNTPYAFLGLKAGPWIWKELNRVGIRSAATQREISRWLLASFTGLLQEIAADTPNFVVLDSHLELPVFKGWWDNEIHPLGNGFKFLAKKYWFPQIRAALDASS
jgi:hypothetical protein